MKIPSHNISAILNEYSSEPLRRPPRVASRKAHTKRELWLAEHPSIPRLSAICTPAMPPPPLARMMRDVEKALTPCAASPVDRAEVPVAKNTLIVDRAVTGIAQKDGPQAVMAIRDLTPKAQ